MDWGFLHRERLVSVSYTQIARKKDEFANFVCKKDCRLDITKTNAKGKMEASVQTYDTNDPMYTQH